MSSETPSVPPAEDRPPEPFARGRIVWSRPPQTVFRVGPLPRAVPPPAARPVRRPGAGILTGSLIPPTRAASPVADALPEAPVEPVVEAVAPQPEPVAPEPVVEANAPEPEPEPEPEPVVAAIEPEVEPVQVAPTPAPQEIVIEPEAAEPAVTAPPPLSTEAKPAARPRELPSVVVTPAIYATMGAAMQKVARGDRWPIVAGVAALVVIGGFIWLATLPAPQPVAPAPTPLVAGAAPLEGTPVVEEAPPPVERPAPVRAAPAPASAAPAASVTAQPRPTPPQAAPVTAVPPAPVDTTPRPYIETAPLVVEPPTPAAPAPRDPEAPVSTAPQPLDQGR